MRQKWLESEDVLVKGSPGQQHSYLSLTLFCRHLRPSMLQQLLRRLVFDVPLLTDYCKMPLRVGNGFLHFPHLFLNAVPVSCLYLMLTLSLLACLSFNCFMSFFFFAFIFCIISFLFFGNRRYLLTLHSPNLLHYVPPNSIAGVPLICWCSQSHTHTHSKVRISNTPVVLITWCNRGGQLQWGKQ